MRLSIGTRLVIGFLSIVFCLGLTVALGLRGLYSAQAEYEKAIAAYTDRVAMGLRMKGFLLDEVRAQKNYLLRGAPVYLEEARARGEEVDEAQRRLVSLAQGDQSTEVKEVTAAVEDLRVAFEAAAGRRAAEGIEAADSLVIGKAAAAVDALDRLVARAEAEAEAARAAAARHVLDTRRSTMVLTFVVLLIALALALALSLSVTRPLRRLREDIDALTAGVTPSLDAPIAGRDEVAQIQAAFREMVSRASLLREMESRSRRLEALSARVAQAQEAERERISRELHDGLGQALTAIKLDLSAAERRIAEQPAEAAEAIERAIRLVSESLEELRGLAYDLRPPSLDTLGLVPALRSYAREFEQRTGIKTAIVADALQERLSYAVETALYRICQEALTNTAKHSGAESVTIRLTEADDTIGLVIVDEGRGFDTQAVLGDGGPARGLGLLGMERRAADLRGSFRVESVPGGGTTIKVRVPRRIEGVEQDP